MLERIDANVFVGAFIEKQIVGFAGRHIEGTIGFVEVIKEYRPMRLHEKLGYERSDDIITWYM